MDYNWLVGVDIGGTTIKIGFITRQGEIIKEWEIPTNKKNKGEEIPQEIAASIRGQYKELNVKDAKLVGVGVGAPGPIDDRDGSVVVGVNIGWRYFPLKERLERELALPVMVDNDANAAALGEMWMGAGNGAKNLLCVTLGTGIGGGVIANGKILHGVNGAAGEIGHIKVEAENGIPCNCGKKGCLETVSSATGIVRLAQERLRNTDIQSKLRHVQITSKIIFDYAKEGDPLALQVIDRVSFYLALALANAANVVNPEKIVIGGGVSKAGDDLLIPIEEKFEQFAFPRVAEGVEFTRATLGNRAGIIGAAWLVLEKNYT